jgi:hypothetical protein
MKKALWGAFVTLWVGASYPSTAPPPHVPDIQGLNRTARILLTLADSLNPQYRYGPGDLAGIRERPDFLIDEDSGTPGEGKGSFAYSFRFNIGEFASSGYLKIFSLPSTPSEQPEEGWNDLGVDSPTGAGVQFRRVRKSAAVGFNEVSAVSAKGNLMFAVSLRRPPGETEAAARQAVLGFFARLLENAGRYGLLYRIRVLVMDAEEGEPLADNAVLNSAGRENEETSIPLKIAAVDDQGKVLPDIDYYTIRLNGFLGRFARIEGAVWNWEKGLYEAHNPAADGAEIRLVYPALADANFSQALRQDEIRREGFGIVLNVDAAFKPARQGEKP